MVRTFKVKTAWPTATAGAVLTAAVGLVLFAMGGWAVYLSYDLLFALRTGSPPDDIIIVYMDDVSFRELGQVSTPNWDRDLHAGLLQYLTRAGAKAVVFDIVFSEPGTPEANRRLADAMRQNGKVIVAAGLSAQSRPQISSRQPLLPLPEFQDAAAGWGIAAVDLSSTLGRVVRRFYSGTAHQPSLAWTAAGLVSPATRERTQAEPADAWLDYYGPPLSLPHVSYWAATNQPPAVFAGKYVFIGARPTTLKAQDEADQFRTPYTLLSGELSPGVEIGATAFLNVVRHDFLHRLPGTTEAWIILLTGIVLGVSLSLLRPGAATLAAGAVLLLCLVSAVVLAENQLWYSWTVIAGAQIPAGWAWSLRCHYQRLKFEKAVLENSVRPGVVPSAAAADIEGLIPDHVLLRRVGKGAYGEVWLARNTIGVFHAVKVVRRQEFPNSEPYEREFRGIQNFMPISRSHPGFVHVLHIGRNDTLGFFFYIMELCDDEVTGPNIDPERYSPKTLAVLLAKAGTIRPAECINLGLELSSALSCLHAQNLVHRDLKPGNIIFVNQRPKFADVGLVASVADDGGQVSSIGTEGYMPPEGPGTPAADLYALGKVLYEALMGRDRRCFPEVPTAILEQPATALVRQLNTVICRACETSVDARYRTAAEIHDALLALISKPGGADT